MTKELLLATRGDFKAATGDDEQAQRVQRIYRILRREGLYNWRKAPVTRDGFVPKMAAVFGLSQIGSAETEKFIKFLEAQTGGRFDAAIDELFTALGRARAVGAERQRVVDGWNALWAETWAGVALTYEMEASRGPQSISLTWDLERARFTIRVLEEGNATTQKMQTTVTGLVGFAFDREARNLIVSVRPAQMPITSGNPDIQSATAQPRVGPPVRRKDEAPDDKEAKEDEKEKGKGETSPDERTDKQEQIDAKRRRIEEIESDKAHVWENTQTGEKIRQKRFRKLKEPFEYKGEGYAEPDADDKIKRLEREIAELEGRTPPADAEPTPAKNAEETPSQRESTPKAGGGPRGPFFSFAKKVYFHDELVEITTFNDFRKYRVEMVNMGAADVFSSPDRFDPDYSTRRGFWGGLGEWRWGESAGDGRGLGFGKSFKDYHVMYIGDEDKPPWRYAGSIRIVRRDGLLPGAVKIVGGERQPLGKELIVEVDIPDRLIAGRGEGVANRYGKRNFFLDIVAAGRPVRGGTVEPERLLGSSTVKASHSRIDISDTVYKYNDASEPGLYLIRLRADSFVVDQARLLVTVDALPGSVKLIATEPLSAGEDFSVVFDAPPLLDREFDYSIQIVRLLENGRARLVSWVREHGGRPSGTPILFLNGVVVGGQYAIRLILSYSDDWGRQYYTNPDDNRKEITSPGDYTKNYILDSLVVQIGAVKPGPHDQVFSIAGLNYHDYDGRDVGVEGKKFPVEFFLPIWKTDRDAFYARLYRVDGIPADQPSLGFGIASGSQAGDLVKEWPIEMGRKTAWNIGDDLPPGSYALTVPVTPTRELVRYIHIVPKFSSIKISLGGRRRFQYRESIPVSVIFPDSVSSEIKNHRLIVELVKVGGHVPGCAIELRALHPHAVHRRVIIEPGKQLQPLTMQPLDEVGLYLMRLSSFDSGVILDEVAFEVVSEPLPDVISLAGGPLYTYNGIDYWWTTGGSNILIPIEARIKLPADHPLAIEHERYGRGPGSSASLVYGFFDHGAIAVGGATSFPTGDVDYYSLKPNGGQGTVKGFMGHPGSFEVRLYHRYTYYRKILIASAPFTVVDSASPFPLSHGLESVSLRNDLITPNNPWPPVGEYLNGDNCEPEVVPVEKMDLRFVRWEEGEYVPVDGALDFGDAFYLEGRLEEEALKDAYFAELGPADGATEEVALFPDEDDPKVVRSEMLYFIWDSPEEANGAAQ